MQSDDSTRRSVAQRYFNFYRLAAYVLALFAIGHTLGALANVPRLGPASDQVVEMMRSVGVVAQGAHTSWYNFYLAFGYFDTIFFLFSLVVAWSLGGKLPQERRALRPIAWALFASWLAGLVIAQRFLFPVPVVFCAVLVLLLGAGCVRDSLVRS